MSENGAPKIKEIRTRFLYPFFYTPGRVIQATREMLQVELPTRKGDRSLWELAWPNDDYRSEMHDYCREFLFGNNMEGIDALMNGASRLDAEQKERQVGEAAPKSTAEPCSYLKVHDEFIDRWFADVTISLQRERRVLMQGPVQAENERHGQARRNAVPPVIEMFLTNDGIGVLSISITPANIDQSETWHKDTTLSFNYRMSHLHDSPLDTPTTFRTSELVASEKLMQRILARADDLARLLHDGLFAVPARIRSETNETKKAREMTEFDAEMADMVYRCASVPLPWPNNLKLRLLEQLNGIVAGECLYDALNPGAPRIVRAPREAAQLNRILLLEVYPEAFQNHQATYLHHRHEIEDPVKWSNSPDKRSISAPPPLTAPLLERLGQRGAVFALGDFVAPSPHFVSEDLLQEAELTAALKRGPLTAYLEADFPARYAELGKDQGTLLALLNDVISKGRLIYSPQRFATESLSPETRRAMNEHPRGWELVWLNRRLLEEAFPGKLRPFRSSHLLSPLEKFGLQRCQDRFSVYTCVRYGSEVDFNDPNVQDSLAPVLSAFAQVEEADHAGALIGKPTVQNEIMNRRHWAGVGMLGAAHLLADQTGDIGFNMERLPRTFQKYFMCYLVPLLQRLTLQKLLDDAGNVRLNRSRKTMEGIAELRSYFLEFEVHGYFTQISSREAPHRYYRLSQEALNVSMALEAIRTIFAEFDSQYMHSGAMDRQRAITDSINATNEVQNAIRENIQRTIALQESMKAGIDATNLVQAEINANTAATQTLQAQVEEHLREIKGLQQKVEIIEIAILVVYGAHLTHMLAEPVLHSYPDQLSKLVFGGSMVGFGVGLIVKAWPEARSEHLGTRHRSNQTAAALPSGPQLSLPAIAADSDRCDTENPPVPATGVKTTGAASTPPQNSVWWRQALKDLRSALRLPAGRYGLMALLIGLILIFCIVFVVPRPPKQDAEETDQAHGMVPNALDHKKSGPGTTEKSPGSVTPKGANATGESGPPARPGESKTGNAGMVSGKAADTRKPPLQNHIRKTRSQPGGTP